MKLKELRRGDLFSIDGFLHSFLYIQENYVYSVMWPVSGVGEISAGKFRINKLLREGKRLPYDLQKSSFDLRKWPLITLFSFLLVEAQQLMPKHPGLENSRTKELIMNLNVYSEALKTRRKEALQTNGASIKDQDKIVEKLLQLRHRWLFQQIVLPRPLGRGSRQRLARQRKKLSGYVPAPKTCQEMLLSSPDSSYELDELLAVPAAERKRLLKNSLVMIAKGTAYKGVSFSQWIGGHESRGTVTNPLNPSNTRDLLSSIANWLELEDPKAYELRRESEGYYLPRAKANDPNHYLKPPDWPEAYKGRICTRSEAAALKGAPNGSGLRYRIWFPLNFKRTNPCQAHKPGNVECSDCAERRYRFWYDS